MELLVVLGAFIALTVLVQLFDGTGSPSCALSLTASWSSAVSEKGSWS
jgi:sugar phosphate permease